MILNENSIEVKLDSVIELIKNRSSSTIENDAQVNLGMLLDLISKIKEKPECYKYVPLLEIAVMSSTSERPNNLLTKEIVDIISYEVNKHGIVWYQRCLRKLLFMFPAGRARTSAPTRVILGLIVFFLCTVLFYFLAPKLSASIKSPFLSNPIFWIVSLFGALGSVISIMVRLNEFQMKENIDESILFFTGLFKPIIGSCFALFVYAAFLSGIIPISVDEKKMEFFFVALSFVAGFSERFAQDVVTVAEKAGARSSANKKGSSTEFSNAT